MSSRAKVITVERAGRVMTISRVETTRGVEWEIDMDQNGEHVPVVVARTLTDARAFVRKVGVL